MVVVGTLYTPVDYHRSWRALIAAKFSQAKVSMAEFIPGKTDQDPAFLSKFPAATVPVFEGSDGTCLFDANAIAFYLGTDALRGGNLEHLVTQWANYADNSILPAVATWVYPCLGVTQQNKQNTEKAKAHLRSVLNYINNRLRSTTFLVGERLSQADITMFTALHPLMTHVLDEAGRNPYPHLVRWYSTIAHQPQVIEVVGNVDLCQQEAKFDAKKYAELHKDAKQTARDASKSKKQKEAKPSPKPKAKPKPDEDGGEDDFEEAPKAKNPLASLPAGKFDLDAFKRVYSNEDIESVAIPYFWDHFDPETHSIWFCEYKYPDELAMVFMSCNLVGGMFQRLEKMLKYGFASMCIFGENYKSTISGIWVWRGTGLVFDLDKDLQVDYESYEWRKLDPNEEETKKLVHDYFLQSFPDKKLQSKVFK